MSRRHSSFSSAETRSTHHALQKGEKLSITRHTRVSERFVLGFVRSRLLKGISAIALLLFLLSRSRSDTISLSTGLTRTQTLVRSGHRGQDSRETSICNSYDQPGYFAWSPEHPHRGKWTPFLEPMHGGCPEAPDWIALLETIGEDLGERPPPPVEDDSGERDPYEEAREKWQAQDTAYKALSFLNNRTILIVGDSVDRNAMDHLGYFARSPVLPTDYLNASYIGRPEGWDIRGVPHVVHMHRLDTQVSNLFFYGTDDQDAFNKQVDWHAPGKAEHRLNDLFLPFTQQLKHPPSFIQLHSGMWDLALFGRQDAARGSSTDFAIDPMRVKWWLWRMRSIVAALREAYPGVPIWLRLLHRVGTQEEMGSEDYVRGVERAFDPSKQNFFTDLRTGQLREMQMAIARELCLPVNDFGRWWEGYQEYQDKVHPQPLPGGLVYVNPLLHAIWMESRGRERWEVKPCSRGWRVDDQDSFDFEQ